MPVEILQWLNGPRDYAAGVALYDRFGASRVSKKLFKAHKNDYTRDKLAAELTAIQEAERLAEAEKTPLSTDYLGETVRPHVLELKEKHRLHLFAQACLYRSKLTQVKSKSTRRSYAARILKLRKEIHEIWQELDYFDRHGRLMDKTVQVRYTNMLQVHKRLVLVENYINRSKAQKRNDKAAAFLEERHQLYALLEGQNINPA